MNHYMHARRVTLSGPPEPLTQNKIALAASMFDHFARQDGHHGGHLLVNREEGCFCATSFWESTEAMEQTLGSVEAAAARLCQTIWGESGKFEVDTFEVVGLQPSDQPVEFPASPY